ncbi:hypothetical protein SAMN02746089_00269 [Caldanaerobius fijiensis DSM 17918]|uniref:Phosphate transport regulator n=1 Tax=Caldanaerobius fijiensis DSM 17918 TaxID=1121256 RepID=A0A1M4TPW6_9THEO|nr:DUF47 family protein [Caldanaerobius fijiensis]SHE46327.1 hypothetical protein SAMN02746089_00269 [Caldanaerobius fijiensis DSM 17918]
MHFLKKLFSEKTDFYKLLQEQCQLTLDGVISLQKYLETASREYGDKVTKLEKTADRKRQELIDALDETFITPFEREDIFALSGAIDDILDYCDTTVKEMDVYEIKPTDKLKTMVETIRKGTELVNLSLCNMNKNKKEAMRFAVGAKKYENEIESLYRKYVAELLKEDDIKYILKMREIYRHLSNCADKISLAGDILGHILIKMI